MSKKEICPDCEKELKQDGMYWFAGKAVYICINEDCDSYKKEVAVAI